MNNPRHLITRALLRAALLALPVAILSTRAAGQQAQLKVGQRVDINMGAGQRGTIMKIGTEKPYVGCYFIHFDYQKTDPRAGDWHCPGSRPITALDANGVAIAAPAVAAKSEDAKVAAARAEAERYEKEAERLLAGTSSATRPSKPRAATPPTPRAAPPIAPAHTTPRTGAAGPIERGAYECYAFNGGRLHTRMGLNFSVTGASSYTGVDGKAGSFTLDAGTGAMLFKGGALDGQHARYDARNAKHQSSVNFVNARGERGDECDHAN